MADDLDAGTKLELYRLVINRYKDIINDKENQTISETRARVSPYHDVIRKVRDEITKDMVPYHSKTQFYDASQRAVTYIRQMKTCEFAFSFWMDFADMDRLRIGTAMDKAVMLAAILRSLESDDVRVVVTKRGKPYVSYSWDGKQYLFVPESGSLMVGEDAMKALAADLPSYSFSDMAYEDHEEG